MEQILRISLLGNFQLCDENEAVVTCESPRLQALLAYLILHADVPQARQQIAYHFWPVSSESQALTNLRKLFLQLRRALPNADAYLDFNHQTILWRANAPFTCDVIEVEQRLGQLRDNPLDRNALTELFDLYRGELLPSCYDDWILPLREGLHQDVMAALDQLVTVLENQRAYSEGIRYAQRLLSFDPLEEKSYQRLMRLRAADGDRAGALKVYQNCTEILERELGVEPSAETVALYDRLRQAKSTLVPPHASPHTKPAHTKLPLIGRQVEWQTLRDAWQQAVRGQARFVTIAGDAGIGKTRLAEELLVWAEQQGIAAVRTRSYQAQGALAYAPIAELLQAERIHRRVQLLNENRLTQVARLLPKLLEEHPNLPPPQPMTESWQRQQFFDALAHAVLADGQPLVLLFDDLQWADGETLTWLHFLLRAAATAPLLLVGTIRTGEIESDHPLPALLNSLRRDDLLTEIILSPLNAEEVQALAQSLQDTALGDEQVAQLYADTEGNPLFVVESVRARCETASAQTADTNQSGLPPKIYSVIRARLTQLSPETQTLVNLAAVIGRSFTYDVLMGASTMGEEEVVDALDELFARQIVHEQGTDSYDFSHDRIRDVAYGEISRTRRRLLHRRVAEALELLYQGTLDEVCGLLAEHYEQANIVDKAIDYLQRAGERAIAQYANNAAVDYFSRALSLLPDLNVTKRLKLLLARERLYYFLGCVDAQQADLTAMLALLYINGDEETGEFSGSTTVAAVVHMRWAYWKAATGDYINAVRSAQTAIRLAQAHGDHVTESEAFCRCGVIYFEQGKLFNAREVLHQALVSARAAGSRTHIAEALDWLSAVGMFTGAPYPEIMNYLEEAIAIHQESGNLRGEMNIHHKIAYVFIVHGENGYAQAIEHIETGLTLSRRLNSPMYRGQLLRNLGWLYIYIGDYNKADATLHQSLALLEETNVTFAATAHSYLGFCHLQSGDWETAQRLMERALAGFRTVEETRPHRTVVLHWLSLLHIYRTEFDLALDYAKQALQAAEPRGDSRHIATARTLMGHALLGMNKFTAAQQHYQAAKELTLAMEQYNRSLEPMAGLAHVAFEWGEQAEAGLIVEEILAYVGLHTLDHTEEVLQVYRTCYQVLQACNDARAHTVLQAMYDQLQARAATIDDPEQQHRFWETMPGHREIELAWQSSVANSAEKKVIT